MPFDGILANFIIPKARLHAPRWPSTLNRDSPQAQGLAAWYPMLPSGGSTLRDLSGNMHDGAITNMEAADWEVTALGGYSLGFDGTDEHVVLDTLDNFGGEMATAKPCVSSWIQTTSTAQGWIFGTRNSATTTRLDARINTQSDGTGLIGALQGFMVDEDQTSLIFGVDADIGYTDGDPHQISISWDGPSNIGAILVDGISQSITYNSQTTPDNFANFNKNQFIGGFNDGGAPLTPIVANLWDFRFYNRIPSDAERSNFWNPSTRWDLYYELGRRSYFFPVANGAIAAPQGATQIELVI